MTGHVGLKKSLILGCAVTGAKFTPRNHYDTGDDTTDRICSGGAILVTDKDLGEEATLLYEIGCRYYHYHARNPVTREQTTDNEIYQKVSTAVQRNCRDMIISFGASRNGCEVQDAIRTFGEWERVSQCAIPLHLGGAHYVTIQAAIELQIICDLERKMNGMSLEFCCGESFLAATYDYTPSSTRKMVPLQINSTDKGGDYGETSPLVQFLIYRNALKARRQLGLLHEVEWVQLVRSYAMTRLAVEHPLIRLGDSGQINIILLFGFSPRLPFPDSYDEFLRIIKVAKSLECDISGGRLRRRKVTITVGAAVMPQDAERNYKPVDVGPKKGVPMCALRRLATYAAQPESEVDVVRAGMEDTPYVVDEYGCVTIGDNYQLMQTVIEELRANGVTIETDHESISQRMGIAKIRDALLGEQRQRPLGEFGFPLTEEAL